MERNHRGNVLLAELLAALLMFMLAATVLLELFAAAHDRSVRAQLCSDALAQARNLSARMTAAEDAEALLKELGGAEDGEMWILEDGGLRLEVALKEERTQAGTLRSGEIRAAEDGETLFALPWAKYCPEAGT